VSALLDLDEEEAYLYAILMDPSGLDQAEFLWENPEADDNIYRAWDFQWAWYSCDDTHQVDQGARALGKTVGIKMRAFRFPFLFEGQDLLITAPELNHLRPLTSAIEEVLENCWLTRQMRPQGKSNGVTRQPHWECRFLNGAKIVSRLPNKDGKGVKGQHVIEIELDEAQDYPLAGWIEIVECLNRGLPGAGWRCHGVPRGVRDRFYEITMGEDDAQWTVHRPLAMNRPTWSPEERNEKIRTYGGSRQAPDYKRNIYGEHGDATNPLFVLARLMANVDQDMGSEYNSDVYKNCSIAYEDLRDRPAVMLLDLPGIHKSSWALAPKGYSAYYAGMDVGATNHPSEILLFGQRAGVQREQMDMLLRVHLRRIALMDQEAIVNSIFEFYGTKLQTFGIDRTGLGFDIWERLVKTWGDDRIKGYNFSGKYAVAMEDRELERGEKLEDLVIERDIVSFSSDALREVVDAKGFLLPNDRELLLEWQGQNYTIVKSNASPYGKREYSAGKFHTLDAAKMMIAGKRLALLEEMLNAKPKRRPVLDAFIGGW
jgi:hypothetical protein